MKILMCGDREWINRNIIFEELKKYTDCNPMVIHGAARGADSIAGKLAKDLGFEVIDYPADWNRYGKMAGPIRNRQMLDEEPDIVIAFHNNIEKSKGTKDCINEAKRRRIKTIIVTEKI